jgi:16S rRNA G966 N2-methylase RsmD
MFIDSEVLSNGIAIITRSGLFWDPPYEKEQLTKEKRAQITANVYAAFAFAGGADYTM